MRSKLVSAAKHQDKIAKVMDEFKSGTLHSGSAKGPMVTDKKQAIAIAISEAKKQGANLDGQSSN